MNEISTKQLQKITGSESHRIFDVRPVDAYNGWALEGEQRGGHIRGAKSLPVNWTDEEEWDEIVRDKGALPNHQIVLYGYTTDDAMEVAERFARSGYKGVSVYTRFVDEWVANGSLAMERMERFETLVYPKWVHQLVSGQSPPGFNGKLCSSDDVRGRARRPSAERKYRCMGERGLSPVHGWGAARANIRVRRKRACKAGGLH